ncbi:hypothetical protein CEXT_158331 [Caerostris extrusa]|uniref:Uncharacterized protein n=1 Tax=Caerostris extrusa TaxID=172846 RepID=A0AAV4QJQ3_CAEEX|nr:hypothetical protein CEXT_158331 [Caerostris extrusa]
MVVYNSGHDCRRIAPRISAICPTDFAKRFTVNVIINIAFTHFSQLRSCSRDMIKHTKSLHTGMIQFWPRLQKNRPQEKCYLSTRFCQASLLNGWNSQTKAIKNVADNSRWPLRDLVDERSTFFIAVGS